MIRYMPPLSYSGWLREKVNFSAVQMIVASDGVSTPVRVGGVVIMAPPSFTTQKLSLWKRLRPEILPLVPSTDFASWLRASLFHARICSLVSDFHDVVIIFMTPWFLAWSAVPTLPP